MRNLTRKRARKRNSITCETIPVAQNMSYSAHSVRRANVANGTEEGDYELIEALPHQLYANVRPPMVANGTEEGDYELIEALPHQLYANVRPPSSTQVL